MSGKKPTKAQAGPGETLEEIVREYLAELDNPSPDWAMRKHWRDKMRTALTRATTPEGEEA